MPRGASLDVYINGRKTSRTMDGIPYVEYKLGSTNHVLTIDPDCICYTEYSGIRIDSVNFPDPEFRRYVASCCDTNRSGWLSEEEISGVTNITMEEDYDLHNAEGIEYFTELTYLLIDSNPNLTALDLRYNAKLTGIEVWDNGLTDLNISGLVNLENLFVDGNELTALDVSEFNLVNLECYDNPLTELVLGEQQTLKSLYCYGTGLKELIISQCPILVQAFNGEKTERDSYIEYSISSPSGTLRIDQDLNVIGPLDIRVDEEHFPDEAFRNYVAANIDENHNGYLNEAEMKAVDALDLVYENTVTGITSLQGIEYFPELTYLAVSDSPDLKEMDLSANTRLVSIDIWNTGLESLDVSLLKVESISCSRNALDELVLGEQPDLIFLGCYGNEFDTLDLSGCPKLIDTVQNGTKADVTKNGIACTEYVLGESGLNGYLIVDQNTWLYLSEPHLPDSISIDPNEIILSIGSTQQLNVNFEPSGTEDHLIWSSSDSSIVSVDEQGKVMARKAGTATITATTANGLTAASTIKVEDGYYIYNHSVNLQGKVGLNFFVYAPEGMDKKTKAIVTFNGATTEKLLSGYPYYYADAEKTIKLRVITIDAAAAQLRDKVNIRLVNTETGDPITFYSDGEEVPATGHAYSAADYIASTGETSTNENLVNLLNALGNYGKYAQYVFNYHLDNLDSAPDAIAIQSVTAATLKPYEMKTEGSIIGISHKKNSLDLNSDTSFRMYFELEEGHTVSEYMFYIDGERTTIRGNASAGYGVMLANIPSALLDTEHEFKVTRKDGTGEIRYTVSALSYLYEVLSDPDSSVNLQNTAKALYNYNQAANTYFGK